MRLGNFSVSLTVKDLAASRDFYQKLGFEPMGGDGEHYQILRGPTAVIGLFQGMFETNILTFNPKWDEACNQVEGPDVRELRDRLIEAGLELVKDTTQEKPEGPASFVVVDPDGNPVLVDQHV